MTLDQLLERLFAMPASDHNGGMRDFLKAYGPGIRPTPSAFERLVAVALRADDRIKAGAAGHQAAIRRLFPDTPDAAITAFCISEDEGPKPSKIFTTLSRSEAGDETGYVVNGRKRWGSMSPIADILYVAASVGFKDGRNQLRMVAVPADHPGVQIDTTAYEAYSGHMPIADLHFDQVQLPSTAIIERDAYPAFIKPFRLIEDVYNTAGTQIGLFRLGRLYGWETAILEDLVGLISQAYLIAQTDMAAPQDVLLMASYFRSSSRLWEQIGENWHRIPEGERDRWSPEVGTLGVAARAREVRRQNAWVAMA